MAKFESSIGSKTFSAPEMQNFVINEAEDDDFSRKMQAEEEMFNLRKQKQLELAGKSKLSEGAKKRIETLLGMTRESKVIKVAEISFEIQVLKSGENKDAILSAAEFDGTIKFPFELRRQVISRALVRIEDVDFENFIGSKSLEAKLDFLDQMDEPVLARLYNEYVKLNEDAGKKYGMNNSEQVNEVVADLKK